MYSILRYKDAEQCCPPPPIHPSTHCVVFVAWSSGANTVAHRHTDSEKANACRAKLHTKLPILAVLFTWTRARLPSLHPTIERLLKMQTFLFTSFANTHFCEARQKHETPGSACVMLLRFNGMEWRPTATTIAIAAHTNWMKHAGR